MTQERRSIFLSPQVDVERVDLVEILLIVAFVVRAQVPFALVRDRRRIQSKSEQRWLLVRIFQALDCTQVPKEGILVWGPSMVGNLELRALLCRIVIDICIAAFREPMVKWLRRRVFEVVVDIRKAGIG